MNSRLEAKLFLPSDRRIKTGCCCWLTMKGRTQGQLALHALGCLLTSLRYLEV